MNRRKVFPLRLPSNFHGEQKTNRRLSQINTQKFKERQNPQLNNSKIVNWQIKRLNKDVTNQRRQFLVHTGKLSNDTPNWFQTTHSFYRRNQAPVRVKQSKFQQKKFDVFGNRRFSLVESHSLAQETANKSAFLDRRSSINVTEKIGASNYSRSTSIHFPKTDVSPKIGSVQIRDYSVKKPQLKIGKTGFIDTYSPF